MKASIITWRFPTGVNKIKEYKNKRNKIRKRKALEANMVITIVHKNEVSEAIL